MALRIPPGRTGRTWLLERLEIARRGADLLDRKRRALLREQAQRRAEVDDALCAWGEAMSEAQLWIGRATMVDGAGRLELLARHALQQASLEVSWSNLMGARLSSIAQLQVPEPPPLSALGASSASVSAARAYCRATRAAARYAVAERAAAELSAELGRASRRLRALQTRWIPQHEAALAQLELALDESQREQSVRVRWATRAV